MATGAWHYLTAERLLESVSTDDTGVIYDEASSGTVATIAAAQVHATLALAAAVGVSMPLEIDGEQAMPRIDSEAWISAASAVRLGSAD